MKLVRRLAVVGMMVGMVVMGRVGKKRKSTDAEIEADYREAMLLLEQEYESIMELLEAESETTTEEGNNRLAGRKMGGRKKTRKEEVYEEVYDDDLYETTPMERTTTVAESQALGGGMHIDRRVALALLAEDRRLAMKHRSETGEGESGSLAGGQEPAGDDEEEKEGGLHGATLIGVVVGSVVGVAVIAVLVVGVTVLAVRRRRARQSAQSPPLEFPAEEEEEETYSYLQSLYEHQQDLAIPTAPHRHRHRPNPDPPSSLDLTSPAAETPPLPLHRSFPTDSFSLNPDDQTPIPNTVFL